MVVVVVGFSGVFTEISVSHSIISNIVLNRKVVNTVSCDSSVIGLVDRVTNDVWLVDSSNHVEVDRIPAKFERLANVL